MVTDKAISRWENGHGFPGIEMFEPLSEALGISLRELMRSHIDINVVYSKEEVDKLITETIEISVAEKLKERRNKLLRIELYLSWLLIHFLTIMLFLSIRKSSQMPLKN